MASSSVGTMVNAYYKALFCQDIPNNLKIDSQHFKFVEALRQKRFFDASCILLEAWINEERIDEENGVVYYGTHAWKSVDTSHVVKLLLTPLKYGDTLVSPLASIFITFDDSAPVIYDTTEAYSFIRLLVSMGVNPNCQYMVMYDKNTDAIAWYSCLQLAARADDIMSFCTLISEGAILTPDISTNNTTEGRIIKNLICKEMSRRSLLFA